MSLKCNTDSSLFFFCVLFLLLSQLIVDSAAKNCAYLIIVSNKFEITSR